MIEMLVVVAIIGLLLAMLQPCLASVLSKSRQASCASNLAQLSLAFRQYVQDYDEHGPIAYDAPTPWPLWGGVPAPVWYGELDVYLKSDQVVICPSDQPPHRLLSTGAPPFNASYAYNDWLALVADANVQDPSGTVLATDCASNYAYRTNDGKLGTVLPTYHSGGWNVAYYDGHVKWRDVRQPDAGYHWANGFPNPVRAGF
jgi:prepilin-type processing-associated H-X9-DG protein